MQSYLQQANVTDEVKLKKALRQLRQHVMLRIITRDLNSMCDLKEVMQTVSDLADVCVQFAVDKHTSWLASSYGLPTDAQGNEQALIVIGMGKLGGYELNVSSDIDLIFAYEQEGETNGEKSISNQEFFTRLGKKLITAIDEPTEDGFVFRVDMRLRPFGTEGALVSCIDAMEEYYQNNGREWERYAWIKGRVMTGPDTMIRKTLMPFVFRKYLDFGAFTSMRDLKVQIQRDVNRKEMHDNIKLGRGGIREIEFIAQVFQLIRGGQDASLQARATLVVLKLLGEKGLLPQTTVDALDAAYVFLRNLEHRLQYVEDQQTQELPKSDEAKARIAKAMKFDDWKALLTELDVHRSLVEQHFNAVFKDPNEQNNRHQPLQEVWLGITSDEDALSRLKNVGYQTCDETLRLLRTLQTGSRYKQLSEKSKQRFDATMPLVIAQAAIQDNPDKTLVRLTDLLEGICRRASYLALLVEYPDALTLLAKLASASPWLMQYLTQHPVLLDELLDTNTLYAAPDFEAMQKELMQRLEAADGDVERQMDLMRHFKHTAIFRFATQDIAGQLPLQLLSDYLSELAERILQISLNLIWPTLKGKHIEVPKFAVIGYGKLGGKELGYASDLDIIFLYDDQAEGAGEVYAKFAQRINNWFNSLTSAGLLYETDLQLRPDGNSGLLVSSVEAFNEYQHKKAWVWEHQALTRARFVAGDANIGSAFEQIRKDVLCQRRDHAKLKQEVIAMRQKMRDAHAESPNQFDIKHDAGGIVDVEFMVQYLVLANAYQYPQLCHNLGNINLLHKMAELRLINATLANQVANAYKNMRECSHALKLQGQVSSKVASSLWQIQRQYVMNLWQIVMSSK